MLIMKKGTKPSDWHGQRNGNRIEIRLIDKSFEFHGNFAAHKQQIRPSNTPWNMRFHFPFNIFTDDASGERACQRFNAKIKSLLEDTRAR